MAIAAGMAGIAQEDLINILATGATTVAAVQARLETSYQDIVQGWRDSQDETQSVVAWFAEQATLAHDAAIAAGRNGVAAEDLAALYSNATSKLIQSSAALARSLYGTSLDREITSLQDRLEGRNGTIEGGGYLLIDPTFVQEQRRLRELLEQREAQQAVQERVGNAQALASNLSQLMAFRGDTLEELAKEFDFPLASLAGDLGMSVDALTEWIEKQAEEARGLTTIDATLKANANAALALQRDANELLRRLVIGERTLPIDEATTKQRKPPSTARESVTIAEPVVAVVVQTKADTRSVDAIDAVKVSMSDVARALKTIGELVPLATAGNEQRGELVALTRAIERRGSFVFGPRGMKK